MMIGKNAQPPHGHFVTEHRCSCSGQLLRVEGSRMLVCGLCGEPHFLVLPQAC